MFSTSKLIKIVASACLVTACDYSPQDISGVMAPLRLADGSVQQSTMVAVYDRNCVGPTVVQLVTYHAPRGSEVLMPIASGTVSGDGQCVPLINAAGTILGYAMIEGTENDINSITTSSAVTTATATSSSS